MSSETRTIYTDPLNGQSVPIKTDYKTYNYLFTDGQNKDSFWPFINHSSESYLYAATGFRGIFADYDISEFSSYILLGFAIIFLPMMWGKTVTKT